MESLSSMYKITALSGPENYPTWAIRMTDILAEMELEDHITDKPEIPDDPEGKAKWLKADQKALRAIRIRVADGCTTYIMLSKSAKEAWDELKRKLAHHGPMAIRNTRKKLNEIKFIDNNDIEGHIRTLTGYRNDLLAQGKEISEEDFSTILLDSLPESWDIFVSTIPTSMYDTSTEIISRVLMEGRRKQYKTS